MEILTAAMAFALLMIVFSTVATGLTESYLRITTIRARVLAESVLRFLKEDPNIQNFVEKGVDRVAPGLIGRAYSGLAHMFGAAPNPAPGAAKPQGTHGPGAAPLPRAALDDAFETLTRNMALRTPRSWPDRLFRQIRRALARENGLERVDALSTYSFLQRLAGTELGRKIAEKNDEFVLRGLTMGFERYVAASNEVFRKYAQAVTMALSIVLALVLNIDAVRLFDFLLQNDDVAERIVAKSDDFVTANQEAVAAFETTLAKLRDQADAGPAAEAADAADAAETTQETGAGETPGPAGAAGTRDAIDEATKALDKVEKTLAGLTGEYDLPIGSAYFPHKDGVCFSVRNPSWDCEAPFRDYVAWFFQAVLAGILIGLGGPFWYRVFTGLSHLFQVLRMVRGQPRQEKIAETGNDQQPASQALVRALAVGETGDGAALQNQGELLKLYRVFAGLPPDPAP